MSAVLWLAGSRRGWRLAVRRGYDADGNRGDGGQVTGEVVGVAGGVNSLFTVGVTSSAVTLQTLVRETRIGAEAVSR